MGAYATVQLEFQRADRKTLKAATVKGKGNDTEQLPLYTNKDSVVGKVRPAFVPKTCAPSGIDWGFLCRSGWPILQAKKLNTKALRSNCWAR